MNIRPIRTRDDYQAALAQASAYFDQQPEPGSADGDCFEVLLALIEAYESRHFPIEAPGPIEAIKFRMEQLGLSVQDLVPMIGAKNRVYEVLAGRRPLTLAMIRALHSGLGLPAALLIQPPTRESAVRQSARRDQPAART